MSVLTSNINVDQFAVNERDEARRVLEAIRELESKEAGIDTQIQTAQAEIQILQADQDMIATRQSDISSIKTKTEESTVSIAKAKRLLNDPRDTEEYVMNKKLNAINGELLHAQNLLVQRRETHTGFVNKIKDLHSVKQTRLKHASDIMEQLSNHMQHELIPAADHIAPGKELQSVLETCMEREKEISELQKELDAMTKKDRIVTSALQSLQENIQETIPRIEAEKDEVAQGILGEWEAEKQNLIGIYGRLCVINREQNYHLMRGTHIKRSAVTDKEVGPRENRLNLDNTELAREINGLRDKVNLTEADVRALLVQLTHVKKLNDSERKNFQVAKNSAEERLLESNDLRQELQIENNELRKLKNELLTVLQSIRENHILMQRMALNDPPQIPYEQNIGQIEGIRM